jgi:hypothetical protein
MSGLDIKAGAARLAADKAARAEAKALIERWNEQLAAGRDMLWSPTIPGPTRPRLRPTAIAMPKRTERHARRPCSTWRHRPRRPEAPRRHRSSGKASPLLARDPELVELAKLVYDRTFTRRRPGDPEQAIGIVPCESRCRKDGTEAEDVNKLFHRHSRSTGP